MKKKFFSKVSKIIAMLLAAVLVLMSVNFSPRFDAADAADSEDVVHNSILVFMAHLPAGVVEGGGNQQIRWNINTDIIENHQPRSSYVDLFRRCDGFLNISSSVPIVPQDWGFGIVLQGDFNDWAWDDDSVYNYSVANAIGATSFRLNLHEHPAYEAALESGNFQMTFFSWSSPNMNTANVSAYIGIPSEGGDPGDTVSLSPADTQIVIDQFGYRPDSQKVAVIRIPRRGIDAIVFPEFDNPDSPFPPLDTSEMRWNLWLRMLLLLCNDYSVINHATGKEVFSGAAELIFTDDENSGDAIFWFDFSEVTEPGRYYITDNPGEARSFSFEIAENVYNDVLKHAVRIFFYQRVGFAKEVPFADERWADAASHLQDAQARCFFDRNNAATTRDLRGGWYDAGDYNKYTAWTARYIEDLLETYRENPDVFGDDFNIPESGNGIPDIVDEARWGMDFLLRLQNDASYAPTVSIPGYDASGVTNFDGSMLSVVGLSNRNSANGHASPPSTAAGATYYGPPNTTATLGAARAFALGAVVFEEFDAAYAEILRGAAIRAWNWAEANPEIYFHNNDANSRGLAAGNQEIRSDSAPHSTRDRIANVMKAGLYLYEMTGEKKFLATFEENYLLLPPFDWGVVDHYRTSQLLICFQYVNLPAADTKPAIVSDIRERLNNAFTRADRGFANKIGACGYRAFLADYPWGSNRAKSEMGITFLLWAKNNMIPARSEEFAGVAEEYLHYIHGVNPFNWVFLSGMEHFGASKSISSIYHDWFAPGTKWDRTDTSEFGPAPGFLPGGANQGYDVQDGFPNSLNGYTPTQNEMQMGNFIRNELLGSPPMKMYVDTNWSWPINSWEISEPSCGYQTNYIRLLSKFATAENSHENSHTVTFETDGGKKIGGGELVQKILHGEDVINPPILSRENGRLVSVWQNLSNITARKVFSPEWLRLGALSSNGNNAPISADVVWLARHIAGHEGFEIAPDDVKKIVADINADGNIDLTDVLFLLKWLVGYDLETMRGK